MAQNTATVRGTVTDPDGAAIPGAIVTLTPATGAALHATSDGSGAYAVRNVAVGTYNMSVTFTGFAPFAQTGIKVAVGQMVSVDAKLAIETTTQVVEVQANTTGLSVDPDNSASTTTISGDALDALSDDPDELQSQLQALAGPSAGPDGGQIYIDGFTGGQLPPKSSIREIRINQNPFSAEYDRPGFGRVEIFTKPGTDKLRGNFSVQGNTSSFNTGNPLLNIDARTGDTLPTNLQITQPPYYTLFMNGNVTGPLTKLSSYSTGGSYRHISDNSIIKATTWSHAATPGILCAPGLGDPTCTSNTFNQAAPNSQDRWDINPRVDMQLSANNTLTTRFGFFHTTQSASGAGTQLAATGSSSTSSEQTLQMSDSQTFSSKVVNETRFEYQRDRSSSTPTVPGPSISVQGNFSGVGNGGAGQSTSSNHIELQNYTSIALSKNFVRLGGRLRWSNEASHNAGNTFGSFNYFNLEAPDPCSNYKDTGAGTATCTSPYNASTNPVVCDPSQVTISNQTANSTAYTFPSSYQCNIVGQYNRTNLIAQTIRGSVADVGLYAETDWKARQNLTISYGIRYESQSGIHDPADFAPRVSFAWGVGSKKGSPVTVIRGGFGIFYSRFGLANVLTPIQTLSTNSQNFSIEYPSAACNPNNAAACIVGASPAGNSTTVIGTGLRTPYMMEWQISDEIAPFRGGRFSFGYIRTNGVHQFYTFNKNANTSGVKPTATAAVENTYASGGVFYENQFNISGSVTNKYMSFFGYTAFSFANGDTNGFNSYPTIASQGIRSSYGRAPFDVHNRSAFGGNTTLPYHISLSPFVQFQTGNPYNITAGQDINYDTYNNDRPELASSSTATGAKSIAGCGSFVAPPAGDLNYSPIPINYCTGPKLFVANLRIAKTWGFGPTIAPRAGRQGGGGPGGPGGGGPGGPGGGGGGARGGGGGAPRGGGGRGANTGKRYNLTLSAQVSNLFNNTNYATPSGSMASDAFGKTIALAGQPYGSSSAKQRTALQLNFSF